VKVIQHPESVVVVALDGGDLVLVRQSRPGAKGKTLELPSGKLEAGETPAEAAARELAEECGLEAREWRELGSFWAAPAYSTEFVHVFEARGLAQADPAGLDEDEDVEAERRPLASGLEGISDAVSIAALALWRDGSAGHKP
jgi:8-oxo-dGTP pyrophosphatase MutT (NUDIX family)